jgi:uncharacterized protein (TIGR02996 family)
MPTEEEFLAAIDANMDDDAPRLAHADWLAKNGSKERAEFIRLQVRMARVGPYLTPTADVRRSNELQAAGKKTWLARFTPPTGLRWEAARGYLENADCTSMTAFDSAWRRALVPPLRWVTFSELRSVARLAASPGLARIRWLRVNRSELSDDDLRHLMSSPHLGPLVGLSFNRGRLSGAALGIIAASPACRELRQLEMGGSCGTLPTSDEVAALVAAPMMAGLRSLALNNWGINGENARTLLAGHFPALTSLHLINNGLAPDGLVGLGDGSRLPVLAELQLSNNRLGDEGAEALTRASSWASLRRLELGSNLVGGRGARAIAAASHLAGLMRLNLRSNAVTDDGAEAIAGLSELRSLDLSSNLIGDAGMMALGRSAALSHLRSLTATANPARPAVLTAVKDRFEQGHPPLTEEPPRPAPLPAEPLRDAGPAVGQADEDGLVREILADPRDELARSVYADWLEENGSPLHAKLLRLPEKAPEAQAALKAIERAAVAEFPDFSISVRDMGGLIWAFIQLRGFLTKAFERDGPAWLRKYHVNRLSLIGKPSDWAKIGNAPIAAHLRGLGLRGNSLKDTGVAQLASATGLTSLGSLDLSDTRLRTTGAQALGRSPNFPRLTHLDLSYNRPGPEGIRQLAEGPVAGTLGHLELRNCRLLDAPVGMIAASPGLSGLVTLGLENNWLNDQSVAALANSPHLTRLRSLQLGRNRLTEVALLALSRSPLAGRLRWLGLASVPHGTLEGWRALAAALHSSCRVVMYRHGGEAYLGPLREILGERIVLE